MLTRRKIAVKLRAKGMTYKEVAEVLEVPYQKLWYELNKERVLRNTKLDRVNMKKWWKGCQ